MYNKKNRVWVAPNIYYPFNTNTAQTGSLKAIIRHLRKQYLPSGISFTISGKYVGEEYLALIK
jgi:hypothetical protein